MSDNGLSAETSFNEINSNLQKLESQIVQNRTNQLSAKNAVLILLGKSIGELNLNGKFSDLKIEQVTPGNTPASVINSRPDVAAARIKIDVADYGISATASGMAPIINLSYVTTNLDSTRNGQGGDGTANMSIALALINLDPKVIGKLSTSNKQYYAALMNYAKVVDNALRETDDALVTLETINQKLKLEDRILANAEMNNTTSTAMLRSGLISLSRHLELKSQVEQAHISLLQTKTQSVISYSKLYQNMGGGASFNEKKFSVDNQAIKTLRPNDE